MNRTSNIYHAHLHKIDSVHIDSDALAVVERLRASGHIAYIVGGSVRDILIGRRPKDFDISTSARPEEIKALFRRQCLLIGRRFRLAHIRFGHKVIEVSTFRSGENEDDLIVRDNEWGTPEDDVLRRDFTINGLFFNPIENTVIDFVGGWEDLQKRTLRTIGNPNTRFKQDPVRMIRLLKFRARLNFSIDEEAKNALVQNRHELTKSSPARVLEEMFRMMESGAASPFFHLMNASGLLKLIFPAIAKALDTPVGKEIYRYLDAADTMHAQPLDRAILTACLLFPMLEHAIKTQYEAKGASPHIGDIIVLTSGLMRHIVISSFSHFPKRISAITEYILSTQYRLTPIGAKPAVRPKLTGHHEFPLALKLLELRATLHPELSSVHETWKGHVMDQAHIHEPKPHPAPRRRRRRR